MKNKTLENTAKTVKNLVVNFPNDADLGSQYRKLFKFDEFCQKYPNDYDLGFFLRKKVKN